MCVEWVGEQMASGGCKWLVMPHWTPSMDERDEGRHLKAAWGARTLTDPRTPLSKVLSGENFV